MKKLKDIFHCLLTKTKSKKLCFLSAMLGYKYTIDWTIQNVPEAAFLIREYLVRNPEEKTNMMKEYFQDPDYIFNKALQKYKQEKLLEKNGFETDEIRLMEGK